MIRPRHSPLLAILKRRHEQVQYETMALVVAQLDENALDDPAAAAAAAALAAAPPPADQQHANPAAAPALRRRALEVFQANPPCSFFTPPHRCIVCLTQTHAPSLVSFD